MLTHTYTYTHNIHIYICTCTHAHIQYTNTHVHTHIAYIHAHRCIHMQHMHTTYTHRHIHTLTHICTSGLVKRKTGGTSQAVFFPALPFLRPPGGELLIDRPLNAGGFPVIEKDFS